MSICGAVYACSGRGRVCWCFFVEVLVSICGAVYVCSGRGGVCSCSFTEEGNQGQLGTEEGIATRASWEQWWKCWYQVAAGDLALKALTSEQARRPTFIHDHCIIIKEQVGTETHTYITVM